MKLDSDWLALLKSVLDWETASYNDIIKGIRDELLVQDSTLTRRATLFSMEMEKGERFHDLITRVEVSASVCHLENGLKREDILILCVLKSVSGDLRTRVLQHFMVKQPTLASLKLFADNLRASKHKLAGSANVLRGTAKPNQKGTEGKKSDKKCYRCKRLGHIIETCRIPRCSFCKKIGHNNT